MSAKPKNPESLIDYHDRMSAILAQTLALAIAFQSDALDGLKNNHRCSIFWLLEDLLSEAEKLHDNHKAEVCHG